MSLPDRFLTALWTLLLAALSTTGWTGRNEDYSE